MSGVPRRFAALRLLLLVLVAFGVAGMHTMGHPSDSHATMTMAASHGTPAMPEPAMNAAAPIHVAGVALVGLPTPGGGSLDPTEVCLAILTAVGLAVLIACALRAVRAAGGGVAPVPAVFAALGRGPPPPALGLVLADLSVLRR